MPNDQPGDRHLNDASDAASSSAEWAAAQVPVSNLDPIDTHPAPT